VTLILRRRFSWFTVLIGVATVASQLAGQREVRIFVPDFQTSGIRLPISSARGRRYGTLVTSFVAFSSRFPLAWARLSICPSLRRRKLSNTLTFWSSSSPRFRASSTVLLAIFHARPFDARLPRSGNTERAGLFCHSQRPHLRGGLSTAGVILAVMDFPSSSSVSRERSWRCAGTTGSGHWPWARRNGIHI